MTPTTNSDSEDDLDYVSPADDDDSDSSDDQAAHIEPACAAPAAPDPVDQKKQRDALWASFQASLPPPTSDAPAATASSQPRVQIEKTYLFAGQRVTEVVEVAKDSDDAQKWPRYPRPPTSDMVSEEHATAELASPQTALDPSPTPPQTATTTTRSTSTPRPGPRKPRTVLPSIPKPSQAKKLTTLDKSAMDWRAHVAAQSSDVQDQLDANKRGGGYLEKVDFLQRVQDRREEAFEASKANKRRRT